MIRKPSRALRCPIRDPASRKELITACWCVANAQVFYLYLYAPPPPVSVG